ncbi:unnamed protein product [Clonostachys rosea]|uniref:Cytochrome P450 n=1 Tax=Bionectria ochroleuca TaxID=29856 RepID=A0ABY6TQX7_BIOOC|nr:unnamed protein product [Clonostachys rosea]
MRSTQFYLVGEEPASSRPLLIQDGWTTRDLKKAVGVEFHIAQPVGISFHALDKEYASTSAILECDAPIGIRIDGQPVKKPQGPQGLPLVGNFYEIFLDHLGNHYRLFRKYGSVIKTTNMGKTIYLTDSPDVTQVAMMESGYFTKMINASHPLWGVKDNTAIFVGDTETENWRIAHKFLPPAMGPKAVKHYTPLMQECVRGSFKVFDELDSRGESWNVYQFMVKLASQTIGKFALGTDFNHFASVDAPIHDLVTNIVTMLGLNKKVTSRGEWYRHLPFGDAARLRQVQTITYHQLQHFVDVAPEAGVEGLGLNDAAIKAVCVADYLKNAVDETGQRFPASLALSNILIVTGAGYTTTSALLSWLIYCITTYPGVQERLLQELIDFGFGPETDWVPELAHSLPYLDKFVKETQRLHNASFQPGRTTKTDVILPGGYQLPADSVVIWRDPMLFNPDRWDTEEVKNRHRCAYIPFATGPRGCIGFNFALLEVKILISELIYRYEFVREGLEAIEYDPEFQLIRPLNLYVVAKRRTEWPKKKV